MAGFDDLLGGLYRDLTEKLLPGGIVARSNGRYFRARVRADAYRTDPLLPLFLDHLVEIQTLKQGVEKGESGALELYKKSMDEWEADGNERAAQIRTLRNQMNDIPLYDMWKRHQISSEIRTLEKEQRLRGYATALWESAIAQDRAAEAEQRKKLLATLGLAAGTVYVIGNYPRIKEIVSDVAGVIKGLVEGVSRPSYSPGASYAPA